MKRITMLAAWLAMWGQASPANTAENGLSSTLQSSVIWSPSAPPGTQAYVAFRKSFTLAEAPRTATLHLFADSRYILWINGRYVLRGPCRFDPRRPEYDSVEVGPFLQAGTNVMAVLVHHYAGGRNSKVMEHVPGLAALLELPGVDGIRTDPSWRCSGQTRYLPSPPAWGSIPDVIDARREAGDWTQPTFDDSTWETASAVDGATWGTFQPRSIPLPRETELAGLKLLPGGASLAASLPLELPAGQSVVVDLGRMAMAYGAVELEADEGSVLQMQGALRYVNGQPGETYGVGTRYTARAGRQGFITGDEWGCHYVTLRCTEGRVKLLGLRMVDRRYPFERVGRFSCSDDFLNRLWEMAVNTIEATSDDGYGADARERNEWLQDPAQPNFITTRVALAGPGPDGQLRHSDPRLLKNLLRHVALSQTPDGRLKGHALSDRWDCHGYIEDYACQWVESLRLYFDATGDRAFVQEMWPALTQQMRWFLDHRSARGLVLARDYTSFDNPLAYVTGEGATLNAFVFQALKDAAYLGRVLGESRYEGEAAELAAAVNRHLWNAAAGTYDAGYVQDKRLGPTAHAALLALDRGVVPPDRVASVRQWFLANFRRPGGFHCCQNPDYEKMVANRAGIDMPVTYYWVFQELYRMDASAMDQLALNEMRRRWARMVNTSADTGTAWEMFHGPESCHNYGSVPAYFLSAFVLGVRLDGPVQNKRLLIGPRLGDLTRAEGVVVTEFGPVPVSWTRQGKELAFRFEVPRGVTAIVRVPDGDATTLELKGWHGEGRTEGRCVTWTAAAGAHEGRLMVNPPPAAVTDPSVVEQLLSADDAPIVIRARTSEAMQAGLEADVVRTGLVRIASTAEEAVANDGGGAIGATLLNGTTRNGSGGDETLGDGGTFRSYGTGSALTLRFDGPHRLEEVRTFAGHHDGRAGQNYALLVAYAGEPERFMKLAAPAVVSAGGSSELRLALCVSNAVALRFEFADGPLGYNVYREIVVRGKR